MFLYIKSGFELSSFILLELRIVITLLQVRIWIDLLEKVIAIVLNFNGKADTKECIDSLLLSTYSNLEIVIVDNGSRDESVAFFKANYPSIHLIESSDNLGYAGGNNLGIRYALEKKADYIFVLNNDTIVDARAIGEFVDASHILSNHILGGSVYTYHNKDELQHFGGIWLAKKGKFKNLPDGKFDTKTSSELDFLTGCALFIPRIVFEKIGLFEQRFFLYYEEIDFCFRARKNGFQLSFVPEPKIWHKESKSFLHPKPPQSYYQWRNRLFFVERNFSRPYFFLYVFWFLPKRAFVMFLKYMAKKLSPPFSMTSFEKKLSILSYEASFAGIRDYFRRSFGIGPNWIYKKIEK